MSWVLEGSGLSFAIERYTIRSGYPSVHSDRYHLFQQQAFQLLFTHDGQAVCKSSLPDGLGFLASQFDLTIANVPAMLG